MPYIARILENKILEYLKHFPVVGLTGPRQSGKSTLLKHLLKNKYEYVTFDRDDIRTLFNHDPNSFMNHFQHRVIFDEVQKVPEIFSYIKVAVDNNRQHYGKYILTGSAQFSFVKQITESLAGRIGLLTLLPFQFSELPEKERKKAIYKGSYPETVVNHYRINDDWYASYIDSYFEKDIRGLFNIGDLRDFRRFLDLLAANASQLLNMSRFANDLGVAVSTIKRWISVLEASYIIFLLPPYYKNYGKRITKSPKVYFYDTGLVTHLTGTSEKSLFEKGPLKGAIFENYIISEIVKAKMHRKMNAEFYYYRTAKGDEVDFIIDRKTHKEFFEIKCNATFTPRMLKQIDTIMTKKDKGHLLYTGKALPYQSNICILNDQDFLLN